MQNCRVSGKPLHLINDFGDQPLGNGFIESKNIDKEYFYNMRTGFCEESKMFQLIEQPEPSKMFHENYAFFSSTSNYMKEHFKNFYSYVSNSGYLSKNPFIVELGCNDGILIKNFKENDYSHLGIEPSKNVAKVAKDTGINILEKFFDIDCSNLVKNEYGSADAILAANVICHIPDILELAEGVKNLLKPSGVMVFEEPYLGDVIKKTSYDQIYDEHVFLFSAISVQHLFNKVGMELIDLIPQTTHGGSMRYVLANKNQYEIKRSVREIIKKELKQGLDKLETFERFNQNVILSKNKLLKLLKELKKNGKKVVGYAATSKSTTILNYCGINNDLIEYIYDTTPLKIGKLTPGSHIPLRDHKFFKNDMPEYAVLFAWNHADEIIEKEKLFSSNGGKWIFFVPSVKIL